MQKSARYFLDKLDQLSTPNYVPGDSDLLHCYVPTLGLFECNVHHDNITFREGRPDAKVRLSVVALLIFDAGFELRWKSDFSGEKVGGIVQRQMGRNGIES